MRSIIEIFGQVGVSLDGGLWYSQDSIPKWTYFKDEEPPCAKSLIIDNTYYTVMGVYDGHTKTVQFEGGSAVHTDQLHEKAKWIAIYDLLELPVRS